MTTFEEIMLIVPTLAVYLAIIIINVFIFKVKVINRDTNELISINLDVDIDDRPDSLLVKILLYGKMTDEVKEYQRKLLGFIVKPYIIMTLINIGLYLLICTFNPHAHDPIEVTHMYTYAIMVILMFIGIFNIVYENKHSKEIRESDSYKKYLKVTSYKYVKHLSNKIAVLCYWVINIYITWRIFYRLFEHIEFIIMY